MMKRPVAHYLTACDAARIARERGEISMRKYQERLNAARKDYFANRAKYTQKGRGPRRDLQGAKAGSAG